VTNNAAFEIAQSTAGTFAGNITGSGSLTKSGSGTVTLGGANSYSGGTTVAGGRLVGTTSSLQGNVTNNAAVEISQTTNGTFAGDISGSGSLTKSGSGPSFDYETSAPYSNSVFGRAGISAKVGDRWSGSVSYNVNFGAEGYTNNIISTSLGFPF
jgi:autotransporter-associated beta strand protein